MLVLSRRRGESIVLPDCDATITVLEIGGGRVLLGVSAPQHVEIHRQEVWERMQGEGHDLPTLEFPNSCAVPPDQASSTSTPYQLLSLPIQADTDVSSSSHASIST